LVWEIHRRGRGDEYRADPMGYLAAACERLGVDDDARAALEQRDFAGLIDQGVHPMSVLFFAHANHVPMPIYLDAIGADPEHVDTFRRIFARANAQRPGADRAPTASE
jgi:hypothetical protein